MPRHERLDWVWWIALLALAGGAVAAPAQAAPAFTPPGGGSPLTLAELRALAVSVGMAQPDIAAAVAMAESSGIPTRSNIVTQPLPGNLPERSFGLWQVNTLAHPEFSETSLLDPTYNAHAALVISQGGTNWSHWSTFNDGTYKRFMGGAA